MKRTTLALLPIAALVLAGCGDSDPADDTTDIPPAATDEGGYDAEVGETVRLLRDGENLARLTLDSIEQDYTNDACPEPPEAEQFVALTMTAEGRDAANNFDLVSDDFTADGEEVATVPGMGCEMEIGLMDPVDDGDTSEATIILDAPAEVESISYERDGNAIHWTL